MTRTTYPAGRYRRGTVAVAAAAALLLIALIATSSVVFSLFIVGSVAVLLVAGYSASRAAGIDQTHPVIRRLLSRGWRDGRSSLDAIVKTMPRALVRGPRGELLAPTTLIVDAAPTTINALVEEYGSAFLERLLNSHWVSTLESMGATPVTSEPLRVFLNDVPGMPDGVVRPRHGRSGLSQGMREAGHITATGTIVLADPATTPKGVGISAAGSDVAMAPPARYDSTYSEEMPADPQPTPLSLITDGFIGRTVTSPAIAGRHPDCQLVLPPQPTISRRHATFSWLDGCWWIAAQGTNPVLLNGIVLIGTHRISGGDLISWGARADATCSEVRIGVAA